MPKPSAQDIARAAKHLREETALEQLEAKPVKPYSVQQKQDLPVGEKSKLEEMKRRDKAISQQRVAEIEAEIRKLRLAREEELRQRRQPAEVPEEQMETAKPSSLLEVSTKPKRGLFGAGRRIKTAQTKAQPETVGRRIGG